MDNLDALEAEMLNKNKQTTTVQSQTTSSQSQDMPKDNLDSIEEQEGAVYLVAPIPDTSVSPLPSSSNIKPPTKIEETKELSFLKIKIYSGRTHQIRAHLSSIGFPILGDSLYGGDEAERIFLHAHSLSFPDSETEKTIQVQSEIPANFKALF